MHSIICTEIKTHLHLPLRVQSLWRLPHHRGVITRRNPEQQQQQLPRIEDSTDFVDAAESVCSREFVNVTGDEE